MFKILNLYECEKTTLWDWSPDSPHCYFLGQIDPYKKMYYNHKHFIYDKKSVFKL